MRRQIALTSAIGLLIVALVAGTTGGLLIGGIAGIRHGEPRPGGHDPAALNLLIVHRSGRQIEADLRALRAFFRGDEHAITYDDELLGHG